MRLLDRDGALLATDLLCYERLDAGLAALLADIRLPFPGLPPHREKRWHRERHGHERVDFGPSQAMLIREKFAFEFSTYAGMGWPLEPSPSGSASLT